ncbi:histidine utilization repressor [Aestuariibacter salexigens]|uniref:histidine utilization repressor n=1 Tax=Aestuariibacter salexigens TaxID=226010 RepID=UPI0003FCCEA0|nr:histidine utilization repressor [Aestuariibacter salexigens]
MLARYSQIKLAILEQIEAGDMRPGDRVPSENQLTEEFGVSRMTARRALTELVDEGILMRSQGIGTFVSDDRPMSSMLTIRSIHDEITQRGHQHSCQVIQLAEVKACHQMSIWMSVTEGDSLYHSQIVHFENGKAIQFEDRFVNPLLAPAYLQQNFLTITPNQYLNKVAPLTEADHVIEAMLPAMDVAQKLDIAVSQPCLKISRRTFSAQGVVSYAQLYHPGHRYRLGGHLDF